MKKIIVFLSVGCMLLATNSWAGILFYDDCEVKWSSTSWGEAGNRGSNSLSVSTERARSGKSSYKFKLAPYGTAGTQTNVELILRAVKNSNGNANFNFNKEYWMGWSVFIPSNFDFPDSVNNPGLLGQFHGAPDSCDSQTQAPPMALGLKKSTSGLIISIKGQSASCGNKTYDRKVAYNTPPLKKGQWNDFVLNFKFSYTSTGFFRVWMNGQQVANDSGANAYNDAKGPYFKMGIYGHADTFMTVYYDEIRVGDANSSYSEVAPRSGGTVPSPVPDPPVVLQPPTLRVLAP